MTSESDGFYGKLTIGCKSIDVWATTLEELNRLISYYKDEQFEFENEWKRQQEARNNVSSV